MLDGALALAIALDAAGKLCPLSQAAKSIAEFNSQLRIALRRHSEACITAAFADLCCFTTASLCVIREVTEESQLNTGDLHRHSVLTTSTAR